MRDTIGIEQVASDPVAGRSMEFVERKGIGHPDSICDGVAEAVSRALSRYYREEFGRILHHNTDKVHLSAGRATPKYGGGEVLDPIYLLIGGRATRSVDGEPVPVDEIAIDAAYQYLLETLGEVEREDVAIEVAIGESSADLRSLFERDTVPRSNDTSFGVGHAPFSPTERVVRQLEPRIREAVEAVGEDVKVMAARIEDQVQITIAAAVIDRYVEDIDAYLGVTDQVKTVAEQYIQEQTDMSATVEVNAGDDPASGSVYLTTTGLSAEMGDDGGVGRGNRANGLITPHRPMSLEATAGKNPVTHVGKLYNLVTTRIARYLAEEAGAAHSSVQAVSQIGAPITDPLAVDVTTTLRDERVVREIVDRELTDIGGLTEDLLAGELDTF